MLDIEGVTLSELREMSRKDQDALVAFDRPLTFRMGTATILTQFEQSDGGLIVNLVHIDGGGEGILLRLWKLIDQWAKQREYGFVRWNVFAATCTTPNPRLQFFLQAKGFAECDDAKHGRIFARTIRLYPHQDGSIE
ncbi:hypothetical protein [Asticcacaulis endophyticus]|uniref:Uncharacterized protein n=1 Tax=Asticcacaulis endophyticus TaxID=1395890 RepID=A0A918UYJ9_9CAUL|nr:hypothetical protein [Asticcacaulis endophyticus]GGZ42309.1 hypothetical protein GCM10011273_31390 [Asticcacaulis endophyticus]